jgi:hypothetical protein
MHDVQNLARLTAELSHLNSLDQRREINVASLKRLKDARDALLGQGCEGLNAGLGQPLFFVRDDD